LAAGYIFSRAVYEVLQYPIGIFAGAAAPTAAFIVVLLLGGR
jgi:hypothetical protein